MAIFFQLLPSHCFQIVKWNIAFAYYILFQVPSPLPHCTKRPSIFMSSCMHMYDESDSTETWKCILSWRSLFEWQNYCYRTHANLNITFHLFQAARCTMVNNEDRDVDIGYVLDLICCNFEFMKCNIHMQMITNKHYIWTQS